MNRLQTAIIADDEAPLRSFLRRRLVECWPELSIVGEAADGSEALALIETLRPDFAFLDIRMPVLGGLEVAARLPASPRVVFVTAYDDHAVEAFTHAAVDYLLKPVSRERLQKTVQRLQSPAMPAATDLSGLLARLAEELPSKPQPLQWLPASTCDGIAMIAVDEVEYFQAADKYTRVATRNGESIIRMPLKDLEAALDPSQFWRIHRNAIVRVGAIERVARDFRGHYVIHLRQRKNTLQVGRNYAQRFKPV